jgi:hypothetical protein
VPEKPKMIFVIKNLFKPGFIHTIIRPVVCTLSSYLFVELMNMNSEFGFGSIAAGLQITLLRYYFYTSIEMFGVYAVMDRAFSSYVSLRMTNRK